MSSQQFLRFLTSKLQQEENNDEVYLDEWLPAYSFVFWYVNSLSTVVALEVAF